MNDTVQNSTYRMDIEWVISFNILAVLFETAAQEMKHTHKLFSNCQVLCKYLTILQSDFTFSNWKVTVLVTGSACISNCMRSKSIESGKHYTGTSRIAHNRTSQYRLTTHTILALSVCVYVCRLLQSTFGLMRVSLHESVRACVSGSAVCVVWSAETCSVKGR